MRRQQLTVGELARQAGVQIDDALIQLWDAGLEDLLEEGDLVPRASQAAALSALGVVPIGDIRSIVGWASWLGISEQELRIRLGQMGVQVSPKMRNLPKGSVAKVRRMAKPPSPGKPRISSITVVERRPVTSVATIQLPTFEWRTIGRERDLSHLSDEEVLQIHEYLVEQAKSTGDPIEPAGVRDVNLLSSAVARPLTSLGGSLKYPSAELAAAALLHSLTLDHAFHNGNKRTALVATLVFLDRNNVALTAKEEEMLKLVLRVARRALVDVDISNRSDREVLEIAEWVHSNNRSFTHGDRPLQFRVLRRILAGFGCTLSFPGRGNRINICRDVDEKIILGFTRTRTLECQIYYKSEGADVPRNTINKIRNELQLDEQHGCDSSAFYYSNIDAIDHAVAQYQTTLKRLARL